MVTWSLEHTSITGHLQCLLFVLSFRYFGTVASAMITDEPISSNKYNLMIRLQKFMSERGVHIRDFKEDANFGSTLQ